ncbi:Hypothetical predicted protein [Olea europaea subsp. europaea]|uniref:Uncharacterized protein n=1 Tax=Olea europaea subsp. europaea TaxID=158383 RepID=A0A8S0UKF4_OLEEU|nr:Hypothetical predicted protein [Olea europaea subsp. europaea]
MSGAFNSPAPILGGASCNEEDMVKQKHCTITVTKQIFCRAALFPSRITAICGGEMTVVVVKQTLHRQSTIPVSAKQTHYVSVKQKHCTTVHEVEVVRWLWRFCGDESSSLGEVWTVFCVVAG